MSDACRSFQDVHDVHSQFLIAVADACQSAAVASFAVEVLLTSGEWVAGVPEPVRPDFGEDQVEETGYANELSIDDGTMRLDEIVACTFSSRAASVRPRRRERRRSPASACPVWPSATRTRVPRRP